MNDPDILVQKEAWLSKLSSHAYGWRQNKYIIWEVEGRVLKKVIFREKKNSKYFWITHVFIYFSRDKNNNTLSFIHVWLSVDFVYAILLAIQWFQFGFGSC